MQVPRQQILRIAEMLNDDPTIEIVDLDRDNSGKIVVHSVQMTPVRQRMRLTKRTTKSKT